MGLNVLVINQQMRSPDRPSLTKICPCGSGKLYQKCHGTTAGSGMLMKWNEAFCLPTTGGSGQFVCTQTNGIDTQTASTGGTMENATRQTSPKSGQQTFLTTTSYAEDFLAKVSRLLESEGDLTTPEALSFLTSHGYSRKSTQDCVYWKTSKDSYLMTLEELSKPSSPRLQNWGMTSNGRCLTQRISGFPRTGSASSLSDILEEHPDPKYFLSERMVERIMGYRDTSVTPLQDDTRAHKPQERTLVRVNSMHKASQADRVYSKKGMSPTIPTSGGGRHIPQILQSQFSHQIDQTKDKMEEE